MKTRAEVTIRDATEDDDPLVIEIFNRTNADQPPMSVEEYQHWMNDRPEGAGLARRVAEIGGRVVGGFDLREATWIKRPGTWFAFLDVDAPYRNQGIGGALYEQLIDEATRAGVARIYAFAREDMPDSLEFAARRGFAPNGRGERMSRLDVRTVNLDQLAALEDRLRGEGVRIATLEKIGVEDAAFVRALHDMNHEAILDIPSAEESEREPDDRWLRSVVFGPGRSPKWHWVAMDGEQPVGVTRLIRRGDRAASHALTGVARAYRDRGIATALKLRSIQWARENGIDFLYTGNDVENHAMLAINAALGYKPLPREIELVREMDAGYQATH